MSSSKNSLLDATIDTPQVLDTQWNLFMITPMNLKVSLDIPSLLNGLVNTTSQATSLLKLHGLLKMSTLSVSLLATDLTRISDSFSQTHLTLTMLSGSQLNQTTTLVSSSNSISEKSLDQVKRFYEVNNLLGLIVLLLKYD